VRRPSPEAPKYFADQPGHTIDLARSLRLRVVAEGAEDAATWEALESAGLLEAWLPVAVS